MARNTTATPRPVRLSQRGVAVASILSGTLVLVAAQGFAGPAALAGFGLYLLLSGKGVKSAQKTPSNGSSLRILGWAAVAVTALVSVQGSTAPGGPSFGVALAVALKLTGQRNTRRNTR